MKEKVKKTTDYKNPGLNEEGGKNLKFISENSIFLKLKGEDAKTGLEGADIFRLAVSIAISRDLKIPDKVGSTGRDEVKRPNGMSWTQGTLDKPSSTGKNSQISLVDMVKTLCDDPLAQEAPWAFIQYLAHAGLAELVKDIKAKKMISEII